MHVDVLHVTTVYTRNIELLTIQIPYTIQYCIFELIYVQCTFDFSSHFNLHKTQFTLQENVSRWYVKDI